MYQTRIADAGDVLNPGIRGARNLSDVEPDGKDSADRRLFRDTCASLCSAMWVVIHGAVA